MLKYEKVVKMSVIIVEDNFPSCARESVWERLMEVTEGIREEQGGLRKGRGCTD